MATQKKRFHPKKWAGAYVYETSTMHAGAPDVCFYINYRSGQRLVWEKIGKRSEGNLAKFTFPSEVSFSVNFFCPVRFTA